MKEKWKVVINAPVVIGFTAICFAATLSGLLTGGYSTRLLFQTMHTPLKNVMTWLRFFTHVFGHSDWSHFTGNAAYLLLLGPILEEKYGKFSIVKVIAVTAFITGVVNYIFFPGVALCGASGVVFAFILLVSFTGFRDGEIPLSFILVALIFIGHQLFDAVFASDNISQLSHIIGGAVGAVSGYSWNRKS
jgi:GlpG protein